MNMSTIRNSSKSITYKNWGTFSQHARWFSPTNYARKIIAYERR